MPDARAADVPRLEIRRTIHAPREAVFRAWTMPSSVRHWFATPTAPVLDVRIEPRLGGIFHIACDAKGGWRLDGQITAFDAPSRLAFTWVTSDCPASVGSTVTVDFAENGGVTEIALVQEGFPSAAKRNDNAQGWTELVGHIEQLMAVRQTLRAELRRTIAAPPESVYHAWTTPALMAQFLSPRAEGARITADVRIGGRWSIVMAGDQGQQYAHEGEYLEVDPPRRLKFTWRSDWSPRELGATVTLDFLARDGGTELVLLHEGHLDETTRGNHQKGWGGFLEMLAKLAEAGLAPAR